MRQLDFNYVDTLNYDQLIKKSIDAMLYYIDPYTVYIPKSEDEQLRIMTEGKYGGVGSMIMQRDSDLYVSEPYENMPAAKHGLQAGDKFISVDGMDCHGKTVKELSNKLRGVPGTTVTVVLERNGQQFTKEILVKISIFLQSVWLLFTKTLLAILLFPSSLKTHLKSFSLSLTDWCKTTISHVSLLIYEAMAEVSLMKPTKF
jgi:C-terminal processing protease CtpA/Prc